jgi:hypothetical protein
LLTRSGIGTSGFPLGGVASLHLQIGAMNASTDAWGWELRQPGWLQDDRRRVGLQLTIAGDCRWSAPRDRAIDKRKRMVATTGQMPFSGPSMRIETATASELATSRRTRPQLTSLVDAMTMGT